LRIGGRCNIRDRWRIGVRRVGDSNGVAGWIGEPDGLVFHGLPLLEVVFEAVFVFEVAEGDEEEFADESEVGGGAGRDAVLGDGLKQLAENEIDVGGGHVLAGDGRGELGAEQIGFDDLAFGAGVEDAERRVICLAQHAAGAAVSELELAERALVGGNAGTGLL